MRSLHFDVCRSFWCVGCVGRALEEEALAALRYILVYDVNQNTQGPRAQRDGVSMFVGGSGARVVLRGS